jgi:hypothetical protein
MRYLAACFFLLSLGLGVAMTAPGGQDEYNDCVLEHLKGAKLDAATAMIRKACRENYQGPIYPSDKVRQYNECLLEYLVGVESFQAAMEIHNACSGKYLM